ncbi:putative MATE family efflux protein [Deinobacterium chartae]|uniref:Multidrug-efflux transporter n=1 Tax=Deinobacterium chartae TaxID=521158 RepID=A0A841HUP0_9DEIO|nr:putative MATE family efflux protein [Deinobacterium chartae]
MSQTAAPVSPYRDIARIAVPVSLEMVFQLALGFVDQVIVGVLGALAIASVGFANSITFIFVLVLSTLGSGAAILVARAHGAGSYSHVSRTSGAALVIGVLAALLVSLPIAVVAAPFLRAVGATPDIAAAGLQYFQISILALPLVVVGAVASGTLRSLGHPRTPMTVTLLAVLINTLFAWLLVFGVGPFPELGLVGAGWATLIAQAFKAAVLLVQLYGPRGLVRWALPLGYPEWRETSRKLLSLTAPLTVTELFWTVGTFLYTVFFTRLGVQELAGSQIVNALEGIFVVGSFGLMSAAMTLIGQAVGQGNAALARARAALILRMGLLTGVGFGLAYVATALFLPRFYPQVGQEVLTVAVWGILINGAFQAVKVRNMILGAGVLPSGGDGRGVILGDVISAFVVGLPAAYLLGFVLGFGAWGVFWARILEELAKVAIFTVRARKLRWEAVVSSPQALAEAA